MFISQSSVEKVCGILLTILIQILVLLILIEITLTYQQTETAVKLGFKLRQEDTAKSVSLLVRNAKQWVFRDFF